MPGFVNPEAMFGGSSQLLGLIDSIYATVEDTTRWAGVMEQIASALGGDSLALFAMFPESKAPTIVALSKMPPDVWTTFAENYAAINPIMHRCEQRLAPDVTWFSHNVILKNELERTECYADFYRPHKMEYFVGMRLALDDPAIANLSCQRSAARGVFGSEADVICQTLRPHLQRALMLHVRMNSLETRAQGLSAALDAFDHAVLGLGRDGRVTMANGVAESLVRGSGGGLRLVGGRLCAPDAAVNRRLQRLLAAVVETGVGAGLAAGGSLALPRSAGGQSLRLTATPFVAARPAGSPAVVALVFVSDPLAKPLSRAQVLRSLYDLTPAESKIAGMLLEGLEVRTVAERVGVTLDTCRFHVKRILNKTGARRQAELVRLMSGLPGQP